MNFGFEITRTLCASGVEDHREHSVIGRDEVVPAGFRQDRAARAADAGIDHNHVDRALGKVAPRFGNHEGGFGHIVGRDFMGDIDDPRAAERCPRPRLS